jgi:hypothetical protein
MSHPAPVNDLLFWFVVPLTLLLVMFIYAAITTPEDAVPAGAPAPELAEPTPAAHPPPPLAPALPARRPPASTSLADAAVQSGGAGYTARHTAAALPVISPPKTASGPR